MTETMQRPVATEANQRQRVSDFVQEHKPRSAGFIGRHMRELVVAEVLTLAVGGGLAMKADHDSRNTRAKIEVVAKANKLGALATHELSPHTTDDSDVMGASYSGPTVDADPAGAQKTVERERQALKDGGIKDVDKLLAGIQADIANGAKIPGFKYDVQKEDLKVRVGKGRLEPLNVALVKQQKKEEVDKVRGTRLYKAIPAAVLLLMGGELAVQEAASGIKKLWNGRGRRVKELFEDTFDVDSREDLINPQPVDVSVPQEEKRGKKGRFERWVNRGLTDPRTLVTQSIEPSDASVEA